MVFDEIKWVTIIFFWQALKQESKNTKKAATGGFYRLIKK